MNEKRGRVVQLALYYNRPQALSLLVFLLAISIPVPLAWAVQAPAPPLPVDPTPLMKLVTAMERSTIEQARGPKKLVAAYLTISDTHLDAAEKLTGGGDSAAAERELDVYNKAIAEAVKAAFSQPEGKRELGKKIEQKLYIQIKTLESIERRFPEDRVAFADAALDQAKRLRAHALNEALASGVVLHESPDKKDRDAPPDGERRRLENEDNHLFFINADWRTISQIPADYLTEEEDNRVRDAQRIDDRTKVFMKIADRRLSAAAVAPVQPGDSKSQKKADEEVKEWGQIPKGSRRELLRHYTRAIEEAIAKIEDAHDRNPKDSAVPRALTTLRDATDRHLKILHSLERDMKNETDAAVLRQAISQAEIANDGARQGLKAK